MTSIQSLNENGVLEKTETAISRFLYASEQLDNTTGLYYLRARQYDTKLGRFTQEDTYLGDGRNLYVYVSNNPLKYVDPSGHDRNLGYNANKYSGYSTAGFIPKELYDYQNQKEEARKQTILDAINEGFTMPDSYAGYLGQQWGNTIAPTIQNDPSGSAYAFKEGFWDALIPFRSSKDYYYTDMYLTGQMAGMLVTGGVSEYISGLNIASNVPMSIQPQYSLAGAGTYSIAAGGTVDGAVVIEGLANVFFGWSVGTTIGSTSEGIVGTSGNSYDANPWDVYTNQIKNDSIDVSGWNKGSFNSVEESVARHYYKHAKEVGASSIEQYIRKAEGFMQNLKGATKSYINGTVEGVIRYKKNGKYIDLAPDGTIISFGTIK